MISRLPALVWVSFSFCAIAQPPAGPTPTATPSTAKEKPVPAETPVSFRPVQFSVYVWPSQSMMLGDDKAASVSRVFYDSPTGRQMIPLSRNSSTPLLTYIGPQPLVLYDLNFETIPPPADAPPGTPPTTNVIKVPKIRVELPEEFSRITLVIMPGKNQSDGTFLTLPLPYDTEVLRPGMTRLYNSTSQDVVLQFIDEKGPLLKVKASRHTDFTPADLFEGDYVRSFGYIADANGNPKRVHISRMLFKPEQTNFFVMYSQGRRLRMLRVGGHEKPPVPEVNRDNGLPLEKGAVSGGSSSSEKK